MAQLIDTSYFRGEILLPSQSLTGTYADITSYIEKYEKQALIDLLGYTLYKELKAEIDNGSYTEKWDRLVNGYEYSIDYLGESHLVKWNGLINSEKDSLIAYFIYYNYMQYHITHTSTIGEVLNLTENANRINASQKMVNARNKFVNLRGLVSDCEVEPTAYNFLNEHEDDDYPTWIFKQIRHTNTFGI